MRPSTNLLKRATLLAAAASLSAAAFAQTSGGYASPSTPTTSPSTQTTPSTSSSGSATGPSGMSSGSPSSSMSTPSSSATGKQLSDPATAAKHDEERLACESKAPSEQKACKDAVDARYGVGTPDAGGNTSNTPLSSSKPMSGPNP